MPQCQEHRIRIHRRATRVGAFEVFEDAHVALRTLLAFSQPVNCIFWPIGMLNWLVAASKLHKHRVTCCTAEWPFYVFLFYGQEINASIKASFVNCSESSVDNLVELIQEDKSDCLGVVKTAKMDTLIPVNNESSVPCRAKMVILITLCRFCPSVTRVPNFRLD